MGDASLLGAPGPTGPLAGAPPIAEGTALNCTTELTPWSTVLVVINTDIAFSWEDRWYPSTGVASIDFTSDVRNVQLGNGAAVALKPALQFAAVRTDRPDAGAAITAGSVITAGGITHYRETVSAAFKFFFRRGWAYYLTAGSFASAEVLLYTAFQARGQVFAAQEVVVQPTNSAANTSYFPLTGPFATIGVDSAKAAVLWMDNANADMEWRLAGRAFNDPLERGGWTDLMAGWQAPSAGDSGANTGEVSLSGLSLSTKQWLELALAVRKGAAEDPNTRVVFHVVPAAKYG